MVVRQLDNGMFDSNVFIIESNDECGIIDAGVDANIVLDAVGDKRIKYIILTHGHFDHIYHTEEIRNMTRAKVCIHEDDGKKLVDGKSNLSFVAANPIEGRKADVFLQDNDELKIGDITLKIHHTPGHTPGGISIYVDGHLFVGDTLFLGSFGRTDFPGGNSKDLYNSINTLLEKYPEETIIHCGHGPDTTVKNERESNPYKVYLRNE